ncbi:hypothetical protein Poly30_09400 [Planctomycetes bacterium Poly30]|uniref:DUF1501 domain-containing protein n=1 Tax=Saltatorellus ferox TaxID=2528018 RepID=A0A518EMY0_9BACT|nr:hypothetical protein Poly30_09400 [Planctomycetes bacterium Poly30]
MESKLNEESLDRRTFLRGSVALAAAAAGWPQEAAGGSAETAKSKRRTVVIVFLRGGCDGLHLVVPYGDPDYAALRPGLAVREPGERGGVVPINELFGLHPAAAALSPLFASGALAALHAVGHPDNTRSHFEEQERWELAQVNAEVGAPGWLGRYLAHGGIEPRGPIRAIALGKGVPRSLRGPLPALAIDRLDELSVSGEAKGLDATMNALRRAYGENRADAEAAKTSSAARKSGARDLLRRDGDATLDAMRRLSEVAQTPFEPKGKYPRVALGQHLLEAARLVDSDLGLEVIQIDHGGFDTHQNQEPSWSNLVTPLSQGLAAFTADMEARGRMDEVLLLTISEFGRTARVNGTGGTDHGSGGCVLALGGPIQNHATPPKQVVGDWPTLSPSSLHENRDLKTVTDIRNLYAETLTRFLGVKDLTPILPTWTPTPLNLLT